MTFIWIGGGILVVMVIVGVVITITSEKELVEERIERYLEVSETGLEYSSDLDDEEDDGKKTSVLSDWLDGRVSSTTWAARPPPTC